MTRFIVVGLGAIGGTIAARLHQSGHEVLGVATGAHAAAIATDGLLVKDPEEHLRCRLRVTHSLAAAAAKADDIVIVATKSQDTASVLRSLPSPDIPVTMAQNGIANESEALRWSARVEGMVVMSPCVYLQPGMVIQHACRPFGVLDVGAFPGGVSEVSRTVADALTAAGYLSRPVPNVTAWKTAKLLTNLGNAVEVVCGPQTRGGPLTRRLEDEAEAVLDASGIERVGSQEAAERAALLRAVEVDGQRRPGGSVWQSAWRNADTEVDYLNGEIVRLARQAGREAPANAIVQALTHQVTSGRIAIGSVPEQEVLSMVVR
ncbi:2-dehydropantoate 2-reductase [Kribbella sp. VKM Ac-2571]|uniref:ketopantoate reductase family protein n=1 Tax=Kribbella sp. VKM Ac-2571 TaxID=2512222 RepID=UPI0010E133B1|nr:2-dehydropantoate 2-reductase N-terminal domain-containing protein [Kribbella sp. VKM Ac-2571]TDO56657.1 2-dehydropantoate 2-reductase [Kribbella sp. VKM Ac-2571]